MKKIVSILLLLVLGLTLAPLPIQAQAEVACENEVVVQASDFLSTIADKYYGNIQAYPAIVDATNAKAKTDKSFATIDDANVIEPGWKLCIPSAEDAQAMFGQSLPAMAAAAPASSEKIELRLIWWGSQDRHDRTIKAIELYESLNPNVDIVYEFSNFADYWTKAATQAAGGNLPDVMQHDYARIEEYVARDLLMPLDNYVASGAIDLADVPSASINGGRVGGTLYGINLGNNSFSVIMDTDAFAKAGLEIPPDNWTWQDFEQTIMTLHEKLGIWGIGSDLYNRNSRNVWYTMFQGYGTCPFSADGTKLGYTDDQPFIDMFNMFLRLQDAGAAPSREDVLARFDNVGPEGSAIISGEAAQVMYWSNQIVAIQNAAGEGRNFLLHTLPRPEGGVSSNYLKPSMFFSITKHAQHPDEAAKFINWFTNDVEANKILMAERGVPISPQIQEALAPELGKSQKAMFDFLKKIEADSSPICPPDPAGAGDVDTNVYVPEVIDPVMFKTVTPEQAATVFREKANEILAAAKE